MQEYPASVATARTRIRRTIHDVSETDFMRPNHGLRKQYHASYTTTLTMRVRLTYNSDEKRGLTIATALNAPSGLSWPNARRRRRSSNPHPPRSPTLQILRYGTWCQHVVLRMLWASSMIEQPTDSGAVDVQSEAGRTGVAWLEASVGALTRITMNGGENEDIAKRR